MRKEEAYYLQLLSGYINNTISREEAKELFDFIRQEPEAYTRLINREDIKKKLISLAGNEHFNIPESISNRMRNRLLAALDQTDNQSTVQSEKTTVYPMRPTSILGKPWFRYAAAAVIIFGALGSFLLLQNKKANTTPVSIAKTQTKDIAPGSNKAILTLGNNSKIILDSAANGRLAQQGSTTIIKQTNGELVYNTSSEKPNSTAIAFNTLTTPRGGQYQLTLPDGTKAWLNAGSSITYPTSFAGNRRKVTITGEVYFEVVHNASKPFSVSVRGMEVEDIGTHFNINAYTDETTIRTTLLEGKVRVKLNRQSKILVPGQQARIIQEPSNQILIKAINTEDAVAWKNGFFHFDQANIESVMRELSRWYDIEVQFEKPVSDHLYGGKISRNLNLSQVLEILKTNNVHFKADGRKITVQ